MTTAPPPRRAATFPSPAAASFGADLNRAATEVFEAQGRPRTAGMASAIRGAVMYLLLFGSYAAILLAGLPPLVDLGLCVVMGLGVAGLGFCVCHDALHGGLSRHRRVNDLFGATFDLLGASSYLWRLTHNRLHHTWPNVDGHDEDVVVSPLLRLSPHAPRKPYHRLQHFFAWPLYALATVNWFVAKDFQQLFARQLGPDQPRHRAGDVLRLVLGKLVHLTWSIIIPWLVLPYGIGAVLLGWLVMHVTAGLILGVVFQLAHVVEESSYPTPGPDGRMPDDWYAHQLRTSVDFASRNRLLTWYVGGLNHQVEHHLFPRVASEHYSRLRPVVDDVARRHHLTRLEAPTFFAAIRSHYRMLRRLGAPTA